MIELVARPFRLGGEIALVVGVDRPVQRQAPRHLDARFREAVQLCRIVGQQPHPGAAQHLQHARRHAVVALVVVEAQHRVGVDGVEASILELIGADLIGEAEPTAFLLQIKNNAALRRKLWQREAQLIAAIATARAEHVPCQARRMEAHRDRLRAVGISDHDRDLAPSHAVTEDHEPGREAAVERDRGLRRDRQRRTRRRAIMRDRVRCDDHQGRVVGRDPFRAAVPDQQGGQPLRQLRERNSRVGRGACGDLIEAPAHLLVRGQSKNCGGVMQIADRKSGRASAVEAERARSARGDNEVGTRRRTHAPEGGKAIVRHAVDREGRAPRVVGCDDHRPPGPQFRQPAFHCDLVGRAEQARRPLATHVTPLPWVGLSPANHANLAARMRTWF